MAPAFALSGALPHRGARSTRARICMERRVRGSEGNPYRIAVLEGDGAGPSIAAAALRVLKGLAASTEVYFDFVHAPYGATAFEATGFLVPPETVAICKDSDAVLRSYQGVARGEGRDGSAHFQLRDALGLFAQMRPTIVYPPLVSASPLRSDIVNDVDLMLVREVSAGALGAQALTEDEGNSTVVRYGEKEVRRVASVAWELAEHRGGRLLNVDKADAMSVSRFWRSIIHEEFQRLEGKNSGIFWDHMYVDDFMREVILRPVEFDVIVTSNLFGDMLAEAMAALAGPPRLSPSVWVNEDGLGVYGPADIYNASAYPSQDLAASPIALIRSASMMLRYALDEPAAADLIQQALSKTMEDFATPGVFKASANGVVLPTLGSVEYADAVVRSLDLLRQYETVCNPVDCGE